MEERDKPQLPMSGGVFAPTGHIVMGFSSDADMLRARDALLSAGIPADTISAFNGGEVMAEIEKMRENPSLASLISNESQLIEEHRSLAQQGGGFLVVYAPSETETTRAVEIGKPFGLKIAHKYNRLTLHRLVA